ncbi:MAG TPA: hypothetical protein VFO65_02890 [Acidimicrobiales bacterium]|nr:hypothetical protein [Acidimicrobiales bacterium]
MRRTRIVAVVVTVAVALVAAGCGGGDGAGTKLGAGALLRAAAQNLEDAERANLDISYEFADPSVPAIEATGRIDLVSGRMAMDMPLGGIGALALVQDGSRIYLSFDGDRWAQIDISGVMEGLEAALGGAGADPTDLLDQMAKSEGIERAGRAEVDGVDTDHYRSRVTGEAAALFDDAGLPGLIPDGEPFVEFDAFVDGAGLLRRISVVFGAGETEAVTAVVDVRDHGQAEPIDLPDPSAIVTTETADDLLTAIQAAAQALLG